MLSEKIIKELQEVLGKDNVLTSNAERICYSYDATQLSFLPEVVLQPGSPEEIAHHSLGAMRCPTSSG